MKPKKYNNISKHNFEIIRKYYEYRKNPKLRSINTVETEKYTMRKFANYCGDKHIEDVTKEDVDTFLRNPEIGNLSTNNYYNHLTVFFRWLLNLEDGETPPNMKGIKRVKKLRKTDFKEHFISKEEYNKIQKNVHDIYGMEQALWETYLLSGARRDELRQMKIKDVIEEGGNVVIHIEHSKTIPRDIPLEQPPINLLKWVGNHPKKDNPEAPLWISLAYSSFGKKITNTGITQKFSKAQKRAGILNGKKHKYTIHDFRRTRATQVFNDRNGEHLRFTSKQIGEYFGWTPQTVAEREQEYDQAGKEELKKLVFSTTPKIEKTFSNLEKENELLKSKQKRINKLEYQVHELLQEREQRETITKSEFDELKKQFDILKEQFVLASKQS